MTEANPDFRLDGWIVRTQRCCIERDEEVVRIAPRCMAVLEVLAGARGAVVSRSELFDAVWPSMAITDDVITQCIVRLRKAFGDTARNSRVIETIPRKGFRLVVPAEPLTLPVRLTDRATALPSSVAAGAELVLIGVVLRYRE